MKLRADNLMKSYNGRFVVQDVSLEVNQGEIVGLLGPNGAGKTTSFYMIVGLINRMVEKFTLIIRKSQNIQCTRELKTELVI